MSASRRQKLATLYLRSVIHICVLLSISRYLKILHPFQYERLVTHGRIIVAICLIWISTVSLGFILTYPWHIFEPAFVCLPTYVLPIAVQVRLSHTQRWWCHGMTTMSALMALCEWSSVVSPHKGPLTWSFDVFFCVSLNMLLNTQLNCRRLNPNGARAEGLRPRDWTYRFGVCCFWCEIWCCLSKWHGNTHAHNGLMTWTHFLHYWPWCFHWHEHKKLLNK